MPCQNLLRSVYLIIVFLNRLKNMAERDLVVLELKSLIVSMSMEWQYEALSPFNHTTGDLQGFPSTEERRGKSER